MSKFRECRCAGVAQAHTHAQLGIFHAGLNGYDDRRTCLRHLVTKASRTPIIRTRWPMLAGGAGAQIIYSAVADRQSVQHAGGGLTALFAVRWL
jgi:hypothetical protein